MNDGSIVHAVQWELESGYQHLVPKHQILYLLDYHFGISEDSIYVIVDQMDPILYSLHEKTKQLSTPSQANYHLIHVFDNLEEILLSLDNIPLKINQLHKAHAAFSNTSTIIPIPHPLLTKESTKQLKISRYIEPIPIYIELQESSQWPKDLEAIDALKSSYYILLSRELLQHNEIQSQITKNSIDIFFHGFVFRLSIYLPLEIDTMEQMVSIDLAKRKQINEIEKSNHLTAMRGLQSLFPIFGTTTRLVKFWFHSHLLAPFFNDPCIELLVASLFTTPEPFTPPNSPLIGFIRFLYLLSSYSWETDPLIIDIHDEITLEQNNEMKARFNELRKANSKKYLLFLVTPRDLFSNHWTENSPNQMILKRAIHLAKNSLELLHSRLLHSIDFGSWKHWKALCCTPLIDFDIIIRLHNDILPNGKKNNIYDNLFKNSENTMKNDNVQSNYENHSEIFLYKMPKFKNLESDFSPSELLVGVNPIHLFYEELKVCFFFNNFFFCNFLLIFLLQQHFGDIAVFFYGDYGFNLIGVVWKPAAFLPQLVKPHTLQFSVPLPVS